jgi:hypothetical protein
VLNWAALSLAALSWAACLLCAGCSVRQPQSYRLVARDNQPVLIPPAVKSADVQQKVFVAHLVAGTCRVDEGGAVAAHVQGKRLRVTVRADELSKQAPDWLSEWAAQLEARGCIAPGSWWKLATEVADAVPLDARAAFRLLYGEAVDIGPQVRIQVDSPILREEEAGLSFGPMDVKEMPGGLRVQMKTGENLLGYERAWYGVEAKSGGDGSRIVPGPAERHINGETQQRPQPAKNYFSFADAAGYYRLIYKQDETNFTALVIAGRTRAELDDRVTKLAVGRVSCGSVERGFCMEIPKGVGANLFLPVTVNGKEELVHWGAPVSAAIRYPGKRAEAAIPTLRITKLHNGKPVPVEFDRSKTAILDLRLTGGETISWQ